MNKNNIDISMEIFFIKLGFPKIFKEICKWFDKNFMRERTHKIERENPTGIRGVNLLILSIEVNGAFFKTSTRDYCTFSQLTRKYDHAQ